MIQHTSSSVFDHFCAQARPWLEDICYELETEDANRALNALRGVFHALRDELNVHQNAQLSAQLPAILRGIYFEDWTPRDAMHHSSLDEFLNNVARSLAGYSEMFDTYTIAQAVFGVLEDRISGECRKIRGTLPKDLRELWPAGE